MIRNNNMISSSIWLASLAMLVLFSCNRNDLKKLDRIASKDGRPDIEARNMISYYSKQGIIQGELRAPLMKQFQDAERSYSVFPEGILLTFFNDDYSVKTTMKADSAIYFDNEEKWEAYRNIVIVNENGDSLLTDLLYGDQIKDLIYTDMTVEIRKSDGNQIQGAGGFRSNFAFTAYKFMNVDGLIYFEEGNNGAQNTSNSKPTRVDKKLLTPQDRLQKANSKPDSTKTDSTGFKKVKRVKPKIEFTNPN